MPNPPEEKTPKPNEKTPKPTDEKERSKCQTYRPPDDKTPPLLMVYTKPTLYKRLLGFLDHFDRPPQQLFLEFMFVEVAEDDVQQFRYRLEHPMLDQLAGEDGQLYQAMTGLGSLDQGRTRLPGSLQPKM